MGHGPFVAKPSIRQATLIFWRHQTYYTLYHTPLDPVSSPLNQIHDANKPHPVVIILSLSLLLSTSRPRQLGPLMTASPWVPVYTFPTQGSSSLANTSKSSSSYAMCAPRRRLLMSERWFKRKAPRFGRALEKRATIPMCGMHKRSMRHAQRLTFWIGETTLRSFYTSSR